MDDLLDEGQRLLLTMLVEAVRKVPRDQRHPFYVTRPMAQTEVRLHHPGLTGTGADVYVGDLDALRRAGFTASSSTLRQLDAFDVTGSGFAYADHIATASGAAVARVEDAIRRYLMTPDDFHRRYPTAYAKWADAESKLWPARSESDFTTIGHLCREAMWEFASVLVDQNDPPSVSPDKAKTVARLKSVISGLSGGGAVRAHLDALIVCWGTASDLVQRQEHGAIKEGEALTWEDGRRVVFQTCNIFYELDRSLGARS